MSFHQSLCIQCFRLFVVSARVALQGTYYMINKHTGLCHSPTFLPEKDILLTGTVCIKRNVAFLILSSCSLWIAYSSVIHLSIALYYEKKNDIKKKMGSDADHNLRQSKFSVSG